MRDLEIMCEKLNAGTWPHFQLDVHGRAWRKESEDAAWHIVHVFDEPMEARS